MSNEINKELPIVEGPVRGEPELVQKQIEKKKKQKEQAKEMFQTEVIDGRIYFSCNNERYYIRKETPRDGKMLTDFREQQILSYLTEGKYSLSEAKKLIRERVDLFPPDAYIVSYSYKGNERIENVKGLTAEQEDIVIECYKNKIHDIPTIKKKLKLNDSVQLFIDYGESAKDRIANTAEHLGMADTAEWSVFSKVCYATGENKDKAVFNTYEEYLDSEIGLDMNNAVQKAVSESVAKNKKK